MASSPSFSATPNIGSAAVSATADTSLTSPSTVATVLTAGSSGTQVYEVVYQGTGTTLAGVINLFIYDGSAYHLYDQQLIAAVTSSTTAVTFHQSKQYTNLVLLAGYSLRVASTVASQLIHVTAHAGNL